MVLPQAGEITILRKDGQLVRKLTGSTQPGINRVWWDLRYESPIVVKLRDSPPGEPWVKNGPEGWRPLVHWRNYTHGPEVWPDTYTVKLNVDGKEMSRTIDILRDPHDDANEEQSKPTLSFFSDYAMNWISAQNRSITSNGRANN